MKPKIIALLIVGLLLGCSVLAQTAPESFSGQLGAERTVSTLLADNGKAPIVSFAEKRIGRLGDGAALGIILYIGDRMIGAPNVPLSPEEVRRMLLIVRMSFAAPKIIETEENRSPKATLVLLKYLGSLPSAKSLQEDFHNTLTLVEKIENLSAPSK